MGILLTLGHAQYFGKNCINLKLFFQVQCNKQFAYMKLLSHSITICRIMISSKLEVMYGKLHDMRST